jgi:hypothetical protein
MAARPKFLVRRRRDAIGVWYNSRLRLLCVGGPKICDILGREVMTVFCEKAVPPLEKVKIPMYLSGNKRFRREVGYSIKDFHRVIGILRVSGARELDIIMEPVRSFGRLCQ